MDSVTCLDPSKIQIKPWAISLVMILTHSSHYPMSPLVCYNKNLCIQSAITICCHERAWPLSPGQAPSWARESRRSSSSLGCATKHSFLAHRTRVFFAQHLQDTWWRNSGEKLFYWIQLVMILKKGVQELGTVERWGQNHQEANMWGKREIKPCTKPASQEPKVVRSWRTSVRGRGMSRWEVQKQHWRHRSYPWLEVVSQNLKFGLGQKIPSITNTNVEWER